LNIEIMTGIGMEAVDSGLKPTSFFKDLVPVGI
jgi:hypothetical protein